MTAVAQKLQNKTFHKQYIQYLYLSYIGSNTNAIMSSSQITPMLNHTLFILVIVVASIVTLTTIGQNCSIQQFNQTIRGKNSSKATTLLASISNSLSYETLMSTSGSARDQQKVIILAGPHKTGKEISKVIKIENKIVDGGSHIISCHC